MPTVPLQEAQTRLADLVHSLSPGDDVMITERGEVIARLSLASSPRKSGEKRKLGALSGSVLYMAADFDRPVEDMGEYM